LLATIFVSVGWLSEARCWCRYAFTVFALTMICKCLMSVVYILHLQLGRSLLALNQQALVVPFTVSDIVTLVSMIVAPLAVKGRQRMLQPELLTLPGGGTIELVHCTGPPLWLALVHLIANFPLLAYALLLLTRIVIGVYLAPLFGGAGAYASVKSAGGKRAGGVSRMHATVAGSMVLATVVLLGLCGMLLFPVLVPLNPLQLHFWAAYNALTVLVGVPLLLLAWFGLSLVRIRAMQRVEAKRAPRRPAFADEPKEKRSAAAEAGTTAVVVSTTERSKGESQNDSLPDGDDLVREVFGSEDFRAGVAAFVSRGRASWTGR